MSRDKFTCPWYKFDPVRFSKCRYQYTTILHLWDHIKDHIGTYECDQCESVFCPVTARLTTEWRASELWRHDPSTCSGHRKYGLITENTLKGLRADIDAMVAPSRREIKSMSRTDREQAYKRLAERQYQFTYRKLFGGTRQVYPYLKDSLHAELVDHRDYILQHPGEMTGTFISEVISEFYRMAPGDLSAETPGGVGNGQTSSELTESSTESGAINAGLLDVSAWEKVPIASRIGSTSGEGSQSQIMDWFPIISGLDLQDQMYQNNLPNHAMTYQESPLPCMSPMVGSQPSSNDCFEPPYSCSLSDNISSPATAVGIPEQQRNQSFGLFQDMVFGMSQVEYSSGLGTNAIDARLLLVDQPFSSPANFQVPQIDQIFKQFMGCEQITPGDCALAIESQNYATVAPGSSSLPLSFPVAHTTDTSNQDDTLGMSEEDRSTSMLLG